ncbi:hypothetical protein ACIP10_36295 [Streptomyces galbus]|uniref:hypothetical protein n=1 Tax=Streptomyces galbus TaxID=33898 RepID=UPI0038221DEB
MFTSAFFRTPAQPGDRDGPASTHRRLLHLKEHLPVEGVLQDQPDLLFALLEYAALTDSALFYSLFIHHCQTIGAIRNLCRRRDDLADVRDRLVSVEAVGAFATTEVGWGRSNYDLRTTAVYDRATHEFVLTTPDADAAKFSSGTVTGDFPRLGVVSARLEAGPDSGTAMFLVPLWDANGPCDGVRITKHAIGLGAVTDVALWRFTSGAVGMRQGRMSRAAPGITRCRWSTSSTSGRLWLGWGVVGVWGGV